MSTMTATSKNRTPTTMRMIYPGSRRWLSLEGGWGVVEGQGRTSHSVGGKMRIQVRAEASPAPCEQL